jgi:hypothetical protein
MRWTGHVARMGIKECMHSTFSAKILYAFLFPPIRATCHAHLIFLDVIILIILGEEYKL